MYVATSNSLARNKNVESLDLLNPDNSESIQFEDIKVYDIIGDIEVSREVNIISPPTSEDSYKLILNLNTRTSQSGISTSVLKYEDYSADIITARFRRHECGISSTDVWINGEVIIDSSHDLNKGYYTLVKE